MKIVDSIKFLLFSFGYLINTRVIGKKIPFIGGLVITDKCNLHCRGCRVSNRNIEDPTFAEIISGMKKFYDMGIRTLFIEGGEPFLWRDKNYDLDSIVKHAKKMGFRMIQIYTNGTLPLESSADVLWVSLDGRKDTNNKLRGKGSFDRIIHNIKSSKHPKIYINYTINSLNQHEIEQFCEEIFKISNVKGIFFYFHTPYYGKDSLFIPAKKRAEIIDRVIKLKRRFNILNSISSLNSVKLNKWGPRPTKINYVWEKGKIYQCCRCVGKGICEDCGYLGYPEILAAFKPSIESIITQLDYLK